MSLSIPVFLRNLRSIYRNISFAELPNELKLNILSQSGSKIPKNVSSEFNKLSGYVNDKKIQHYLSSNELYISFFCPSSKTSNQKLIYSLKKDHDSKNSHFTIDQLVNTQEVIPIKLSKGSESLENSSDNHLELLVDEEQTAVKLHIQLRINDQILKESSMFLKLSDIQNNEELQMAKNEMNYKFEIVKGQNEKRGGYDFTDLINYSFNLKDLKIDNSELVDCIEKEQGNMIVRF